LTGLLKRLLRNLFNPRGNMALGHPLDVPVLREENPRHEALQEKRIERRAERPERGGEVNAVAHQRAALGRLEAVRVPPAPEGAALHLVGEPARGFEGDDLRGHALRHAEETASPGELFPET